MIDLEHKKVMITGGGSMIMRAVEKALHKYARWGEVEIIRHKNCDLTDQSQFRARIKAFQPDYVIHGAGYNGNIQFNQKYMAVIFWRTAQMALNVLSVCSDWRIPKVVSILPSCAYSYADKEGKPKELLREEEFEDGPPHPSVECHGLAKRVLFDYSRMISQQYGLNYVCCVLNNAYGPHDSFDPDKTKVIGGLIKKFVDAQENNLPSVECWGTGSPRREFIYSEDAGEGIVRVLEEYDDFSLPINLGCGYDISIKELAELIAQLVGYKGEIKWDVSKGDGQMKKLFSNIRMKELLRWEPKIHLVTGLSRTITWYKENKEHQNAK